MIAYRDYWFYTYTLVLLILTSSLNSCGNATDAVPELSLQGQWQLEGLTDTSVTVTEADQNGVLIGTTKGLFKQQNEVLSNLGLNNYEIQGVVRLKNNDLLAGAMPASYTQGDTTLFKLSNATSKWESFMTNFGGENREHSWINIGPIAPYLFSDTLFVRGGGVIRSLDEGQNWEPVSGSWDSSGSGIRLLHIDTYHQAHVWTGGVSNLSQPVLWKSTDVGKSWQNLESIKKVERTIVEAVVYDVITHPVNPDITLAGLDGTITKARNIRKSTDGGESWELVLENTGIHTFTHSARTPTTVYASGHNTDGTLFFAASTDFGDSWEMIEMPDSPADIQINDIESVIIEGQEVLYLGTNKGVYSYRFEE